MKILMIGGTRFFGVHAVRALLENGHQVTIATRGSTPDPFEDNVQRVFVDRTQPDAMKSAFQGSHYDVICDNIAYSSNDVKAVLEHVSCDRYVYTSSVSVYPQLVMNTTEDAFDPLAHPLVWCSREEYTYDEIKRQGECALFQAYAKIPGVAIRYPYVIGEDDYTKRLHFYVDHIVHEKPMCLTNPDGQIGFIRSDEAGQFIAWCAEQRFTGPINAGSTGSISCQDIITYVEQQSGRKAILSEDADPCPYNSDETFSMNVDYAKALGYTFTALNDWMFGLLDRLIAQARR